MSSPVMFTNTTRCVHGWMSADFSGFDDVSYLVEGLDACGNYSVKVLAVNMPGDVGMASEIPIIMPVGGTGSLFLSCFIYTIILLKSVGVRNLQVAILARSSREMYLTVRID